jgi:hypothetical protein
MISKNYSNCVEPNFVRKTRRGSGIILVRWFVERRGDAYIRREKSLLPCPIFLRAFLRTWDARRRISTCLSPRCGCTGTSSSRNSIHAGKWTPR